MHTVEPAQWENMQLRGWASGDPSNCQSDYGVNDYMGGILDRYVNTVVESLIFSKLLFAINIFLCRKFLKKRKKGPSPFFHSVKVPFSVFVTIKISSSSPVSALIYAIKSTSSIFPLNS